MQQPRRRSVLDGRHVAGLSESGSSSSRSLGGQEPDEEKKDEEKKDEEKKEGSKQEAPKEGDKKEGSQEPVKEEEKKGSKEKAEAPGEKKDEEKPESKEGEKKGSKEQEPPKEEELKPDKTQVPGLVSGSKEPEKKDEEKKDEEKKDEEKKEGDKGEKSGTSTGSVSKDSKASIGSTESKVSKKAAIEGKLTGSLAFAVFSVTLGSFQFGYHIGCVNAPGAMITEWIIESHNRSHGTVIEKTTADVIWSAIVSMFAVGGAVGGILSGALADKAGRRGGLLYTNIVAFIAAVLMGGAKYIDQYVPMMIGRFLIGIYAGLSVLVPIYLTEVSPTNLRGMLGSLHQLNITISILVSQIFGLPQIFGTPDRWPLIFWFTVVPALAQVVTLQMVPESPKFTLCVRGNVEQATTDLENLRGSRDVGAEVDVMKDEAAAAKSAAAEKPSMGDMFRGSLRWPMTIAAMLMLAQQLSGINATMFYSTFIFKQAGLSDQGAVFATISMGTVNVLMTVVSVWLVDHPKAGRRMLLIVGLVGMWISTVLLVVCISMSMGGHQWASYGAIAFVLLFVISFAAGAGSIPWFFVSEIFASNARGNANSIATMTNWGANVAVGLTFLPINNYLHQYSFLVFTAFLTFFLFFVIKYVPETKGKSIEEITAELEKK
uniref:MFS domain-containing protein n=1 Tax=Haemonchus contortus TaxID=6289 RepID=A0A7I4XZV6_HAECO